LQLKADSLVDDKLEVDKWNSMIRKLVHGDVPSETPRLKLKRNAYATAIMEKNTNSKKKVENENEQMKMEVNI
ncbi:Protein CBR-KRI-1, partial [Caenorhabditis briggsae]